MKKRIFRVLLLVAATVAVVLCFSACGETASTGRDGAYELWKREGNVGSEPEFLEWIRQKSKPSVFESAVFESKTVVYDGSEHVLSVTGAPDGTEIEYANNSGTEVGEYRAFAYLKKSGDETVLTAVLTVEKAEITEYGFKDTVVTYNGGLHTLTVQNLQSGVTAEYFCGGVPFTGATDAGEYVITARLSGELYKPLVISAKLTVEKADAGVGFGSKTVEYDVDKTHTVTVGGVPAGVTVAYKDANGGIFNGAKLPGTYPVTAVISGGKNYKNAELKATLTIKKADLSGKIFFNNATFKYDGEKKNIYITGELPEDASVRYTMIGGAVFDGRIEKGQYFVDATVSGEYYEKLTLYAHLYIVDNVLDTPVGVTVSGKDLTWTRDFKAGMYVVAVYDASGEFVFFADSTADAFYFDGINKCRIGSLLRSHRAYSGEYTVTVKAFPNTTNESSFAESEESAPMTYTLTEGILSPPQNVRVIGDILSWDAVPSAEYYNVAVQFVDGDGNVIYQKEIGGTIGNNATSMSVSAIVKKAGYGTGNYRFAVLATPVSVAPNGQSAEDTGRKSDCSDFTSTVFVTV